ncbi:MAG: glycosyl transferase family 2 [Nanoarchaeota archaeon]|nr:glycosyl transferase family 2 [Nanoarchaeota archaeon]|tara:strand:+ start:1304 stop:2182 length:879 start_codon:yes stop_codon:yes gene_type:complete
MKVIITIPAYNEEKTIVPVIEEIKRIMSQTSYDYKIHVQDDGSKDRTAELAKKAGAIVSSNPRNMGLAENFQAEMISCLKLKADVIVHTDADGQYLPYHIPQLIKKVEEGYDLVLGSRFRGKIRGMPLTKRIGNKMFSKVISSLTKLKITDSTTGFRAFTKDVAQNIEFINRFTYTQEQIIKAAKQNFKVIEIPIETRKTRDSRLFKNPLEYAVKAWINILRIYRDYDPLNFFGIIGFIFLLFGFLIGLYFFYLHVTVGIVGHVGLMMLMLLLIINGIQIIMFGFFADMKKK